MTHARRIGHSPAARADWYTDVGAMEARMRIEGKPKWRKSRMSSARHGRSRTLHARFGTRNCPQLVRGAVLEAATVNPCHI